MPLRWATGLAVASLLAMATVPASVSASATSVVTVNVAAGAGAGPRINQDLIGVDGPGPAGATTSMAEIGVRWVRTDVSFESSYNCATGEWSSTRLDQRVAQIYAEGARPLLIVDYTPSCLATGAVPGDNSSYYPPDLGTHQVQWDRLVAQMATHEITTEGVRDFEIWNEPDGTFWRGSLPGYLLLYRDTASVLERAAAGLHTPIAVGGPALVFSDASWIEPFLATAVAERLPVDFLSWHYYADYPLLGPIGPIPAPPPGTPPFWYNPLLRAQIFGAQTRLVQSELARYPSLHPVLWLDEWNADAGYDARMSGPFDAALAAAVLDSMQQAGLDRAAFFDVADDAGNRLANWGMLTAPDANPALSVKPVWWTFLFWHGMAERAIPVSVSPDQSLADPTGRIGAVAAASPDGSVTVLAYNVLPYDLSGAYGTTGSTADSHAVQTSITGLRPGVRYQWTRTVPGGAIAGSGSATGPSARVSFDLPAEGVAFLTFWPAP